MSRYINVADVPSLEATVAALNGQQLKILCLNLPIKLPSSPARAAGLAAPLP